MHRTMKGNQFGRRDLRVMLAMIFVAMAVLVQGQTTDMPPVDTPTSAAPVAEPTPADSPAPVEPQPTTEAPVEPSPTTQSPTTGPPTSTPPTTPTPVQTDAPTVISVTTEAPTDIPVTTELPTVMPVATDVPTAMPVETEMPTVMPVATDAPTLVPTVATPPPTVATAAPTRMPSTAPSAAPSQPDDTPSPTQAGSFVAPAKFPNLSMSMTGVSPLSTSSWKAFAEVYKNFNDMFYTANPQFGISELDVLLELVKQDPPPSRRRLGEWPQRQLQDETLTVIYNQAITYKIVSGSGLTSADVVTQPFATQTSRDAFAGLLRQSDDPAFATVDSVSGVSQATDPDSGDSGGLPIGAIIGIAVGGFAGLVLLVGGGYLLFKGKDGGYAKDVGDQPPSSLNLGGADDVSTLQDPARDNRISTYGDQSVATVDYDYSKAYGGGGDTSVVSSVGGTLGSQTQATAAGAGAVDASFSDDASFEANYHDPNANVKEVALEVWAPPGKLGVVIDTPNDGAPVVHAIKDSSPIADKLQVGDKLIAVDEENVETMTAIKVSKLISRKSANSTRKLSIVRTVVDE